MLTAPVTRLLPSGSDAVSSPCTVPMRTVAPLLSALATNARVNRAGCTCHSSAVVATSRRRYDC